MGGAYKWKQKLRMLSLTKLFCNYFKRELEMTQLEMTQFINKKLAKENIISTKWNPM